MIRLIATDFDGTLLDSRGEISEYTKSVLCRARAKGIRIAACTGRYYYGARLFAAESLFDAYICGNGADIRNKDGMPLIFQSLSDHSAIRVLQYAENRRLHCNIYKGDCIFSDSVDSVMDYYIQRNREGYLCPLSVVPDLFSAVRLAERKIMKIEIRSIPDGLLHELKAFLNSIPDIACEGNFKTSVEIHDKNVNKGTGLRFIEKYFRVVPADTLAFGDAENDISFIRAAGIGVAMGNAIRELKETATYCTDSNDEDGVGKGIIRFCEDL